MEFTQSQPASLDDVSENQKKQLFQTLGDQINKLDPKEASVGPEEEVDGPELINEIESLCMNCNKNVGSHSAGMQKALNNNLFGRARLAFS